MLPINCDIGERGADHPVDTELMALIDIASVACGGHAGDLRSVEAFRTRAESRGITVAAHLAYPDRENFGRRSITISPSTLLESLSRQYALMADVTMVKFHGALYNDSCRRIELAESLARWLAETACTTVITAPFSALAWACAGAGITVITEAFAERRYQLDTDGRTISLVSRERSWANIHDLEQAFGQARQIAVSHTVDAVIEADGKIVSYRTVPLQAQTICIHSDSRIAVDLARELRK